MTDKTNTSDEKAQILQIDFPTQNAYLGSKVKIRGKAVPAIPGQDLIVEANRTLYPPVDANGDWSVEEDLTSSPYASLTITAMFANPLQRFPVNVTWRRNLGTEIKYPDANALLYPGQSFQLRGTAVTGSTVTVRNPVTGYVFGTPTAGAFGVWFVVINPPSDATSITVEASHNGFGGSHEPTRRSFRFGLAAPEYTPYLMFPESGTTHEQTMSFGGLLGAIEGVVEILADGRDTKYGESELLTSTIWTASATLPAGPVSVVARNVRGGHKSDRSNPRGYRIRPPAFVEDDIKIDYADNAVIFSGSSAYAGATVVITVTDSAVEPPPLVVATDGKWTTTATGWPYGTYKLQIVQKVSDNANGWIESQPCPLEVEKKLPNVRELQYTRDYQPTFSGLGNKGATVSLWKIDANVAVAPPVTLTADGSWLSQASEVWGPTLNRRVRIKQAGFSQETDWVFLDVTIPPLAPGLSDPEENGLSPVFSGTCWPGAQVTLTFSDSDQSYHATVTDGFWTFQRLTDFTAGVEHTVRVIQTAASQPSAPTERFFSVYPTMIQPVITEPGNKDDVDHAFTLKGHGAMKGAMLQVFDRVHNIPLSDSLLQTMDGDWAIDIKDLTLRSYGIGIRQTSHNRVIESERLDVNVVVLPPRITCPVEDSTLPRGDFLQGEGRAGAKVDILKGDEPWLMDIPVGLDGIWSHKVELPVGSTTLRARQTFVENDKPFPSEYADERHFSVVPAAPFIETPVAGEHIGRQVVVSGFGVPGDTVSVTLDSECASASVLEDRTWSVRLTLTQTGGEHVLQATAALGEFESDAAPRLVLLGTYEPGIETPASGHRVSNPLLCAGTGRPGAVQGVSWYNPEETVLHDVAVSGGRWSGQAAQALREGGQWLRFMQTLEGGEEGQLSAWVDSQRFEVEPDALSKTQSKKSDERF